MGVIAEACRGQPAVISATQMQTQVQTRANYVQAYGGTENSDTARGEVVARGPGTPGVHHINNGNVRVKSNRLLGPLKKDMAAEKMADVTVAEEKTARRAELGAQAIPKRRASYRTPENLDQVPQLIDLQNTEESRNPEKLQWSIQRRSRPPSPSEIKPSYPKAKRKVQEDPQIRAEKARVQAEIQIAEEIRRSDEAQIVEEQQRSEEVRIAGEQRRAEEARFAEEQRKLKEASEAKQKQRALKMSHYKELLDKLHAYSWWIPESKSRLVQRYWAATIGTDEKLDAQIKTAEKQIEELSKAVVRRIKAPVVHRVKCTLNSADPDPGESYYLPQGIPGENLRAEYFPKAQLLGEHQESSSASLPRELSFKDRQSSQVLDSTASIDAPASHLRAMDVTGGHVQQKNRGRSRRGQIMEPEEDDDFGDEYFERASRKEERKQERKKAKLARKAAAAPVPIILPDFISIENLAMALRIRIEDFVGKMGELGFETLSPDHVLDAETAGLIVTEFNYEPIIDTGEAEDLVAQPTTEDKSVLPPRPPVVTIMGHVDHGKTTLLDYLRKSSVAASEHGGITQHIGAFTVPMPSGRIITFLDTPGHAAFLKMRQRGANVTDVVVLVVAADDSVKPQTVEAIKHAQSAQVPMIVAINKIDKPDSDIDRVKQDLARHNVEIEDFGGDTQVVCVSGKTGQGMNELEDALVALADVLDMRAETDGPAEGWILEATTRQSGRAATVLVRRGTIKPGDVLVAGLTWTRARTLKNEAGVQVPFASPGTPIEVDGWREQPEAGDEVLCAPDEQKAKSVVELRLERAEQARMAEDVTARNESRRALEEKRALVDSEAPSAEADSNSKTSTSSTSSPTPKSIPLLLKADVSGSLEALHTCLAPLGSSLISTTIIRSGVGPPTESDIEHAFASKAIVVCFNVSPEPRIAQMAARVGVRIIEERIIYRLVETVTGILEEQLEPLETRHVLGEADIAQVFEIKVKGRMTSAVAGCRVRNGVISKNAKVRVVRDAAIIYDGMSSSPPLLSTFLSLFPSPHLISNSPRHPVLPTNRQERRVRDTKRQRMRSGL